jgi:O-antigen/teichoic acid export membrane protein
LRYAALLIISVLFAQSHWTVETIGTWEGLMLLSGLTGFFWVSGILTTLIPLYQKAKETEQKQLLSGTFRAILAINSLIVLLLFLSKGPILALLNIEPGNSYYIFLFYIWFNNPAFLTEYLFLIQHRSAAMIKYGLSVFAFQLLLVGLPPLLGFGFSVSLWGLLCFSIVKFIICLSQLNDALFTKPDKAIFKTHFKVAIPLAGSLFLGGASTYIDGFIVAAKLDESALAVFQYGAREFPLVLLMANAFSTATVANIAADLNQGMALIKQRAEKMFRYFLPIAILLMVSSKFLFPLVFTSAFADSYLIFNIYLLLIISRLVFPQTLLTGIGKTKILLGSASIEIILNVGLSLILIGPYGIQGVAWATIVAHFADKLILIGYNWHVLGIAPNKYLNVAVYLLYSLILAVCFALVHSFA